MSLIDSTNVHILKVSFNLYFFSVYVSYTAWLATPFYLIFTVVALEGYTS